MLNFLIDWLPSRLNGMWNLDVFLLAYAFYLYSDSLWFWEGDDHRILMQSNFLVSRALNGKNQFTLGRVSNWFWGDDSFSCAYQFRSRIITLKIQLKEIVWSPCALFHVGWSKRLGWLFVRWIFLFEKHEHTSAKMFKILAILYSKILFYLFQWNQFKLWKVQFHGLFI